MRALIITLAILVPLSAQAGSIPLAEFKWSQAFDVTLPAPYSVHLKRNEGSGNPFTAGYVITVDQFPHVTMLDAATVENFDRVLAHSNSDFTAIIKFWSGGSQGEHGVEPNTPGGACSSCVVYRLIGHERDEWLERATAAGWDAQMLVPPKGGPALWGYKITAIERTITADSQGLLLLGIAVPEPATWLLVLCLVLVHPSRFAPRSAPSWFRRRCL
jgi:hypothetical protein